MDRENHIGGGAFTPPGRMNRLCVAYPVQKAIIKRYDNIYDISQRDARHKETQVNICQRPRRRAFSVFQFSACRSHYWAGWLSDGEPVPGHMRPDCSGGRRCLKRKRKVNLRCSGRCYILFLLLLKYAPSSVMARFTACGCLMAQRALGVWYETPISFAVCFGMP